MPESFAIIQLATRLGTCRVSQASLRWWRQPLTRSYPSSIFSTKRGISSGSCCRSPYHRDNHFAAREIKPRLERRRLAEISPQPHDVHAAVVLVDVGKHFEGVVLAAIIHEHQLIGLADSVHHLGQPHVQRRDVFLLVKERNNNGELDGRIGEPYE